MDDIFDIQTDIIRNRARALMHDQTKPLNIMQTTAAMGIFDRATRLQYSALPISADNDPRIRRAIWSRIRDFLIPILGYTRLLLSERMGQLSSSQTADLLLIIEAVRAIEARAITLLRNDTALIATKPPRGPKPR